MGQKDRFIARNSLPAFAAAEVIDQFYCLEEVFYIKFTLNSEGRHELCDLFGSNPYTSPIYVRTFPEERDG
jgi:hypothetical protein